MIGFNLCFVGSMMHPNIGLKIGYALIGLLFLITACISVYRSANIRWKEVDEAYKILENNNFVEKYSITMNDTEKLLHQLVEIVKSPNTVEDDKEIAYTCFFIIFNNL
ncbi:hypothetical protein LX64_05188 [Chitinophaga skermanii]|uniref:Uncharacterized protein n=2 Tax=Chitinophaga skermanii TaxID=331697 RepID=A0A327PXZ2_9BACT|nr:hypothetical protein LX64_05188 [Chitinophaga skermanii]